MSVCYMNNSDITYSSVSHTKKTLTRSCVCELSVAISLIQGGSKK